MLYVMVQGIFKLGVTMLVPVDLFVSFTGISFYYLSKYQGYFNRLRIPLLVIMYLACAFFWYRLGGFYGPGNIGAVAVGVSTILLSPSKNRLTYFLFSIAFILTLIFIQLKSDWIISIEETKETLHINYFLFAFATLMIVYYVKREFDKERRLSEKQNIRLRSLNKLLNSSIKDKEQVIDKLKSTRDRLIDAEKMASIGRFTAGIAHELNNPLNFVGGSVIPIARDLDEIFSIMSEEQKLDQKENIDEIKNLLFNIKNGTKQAQQVMENLLQISPKSLPLKSEEINLSDLLVNVSQFFQNSVPRIKIKQDIIADISTTGFLVEINQVLVNLFKNSIDALANEEYPEIWIKLKKEPDFAIIEISDNGPGIPEKDQNHIFEPFYTTKPQGVGTGVGLYISFTIANKHGGELKYEPLDKGTLFIFKLPRNHGSELSN